MDGNKKIPAVLYVSADAKNIIKKIEEAKYLDLHNAKTSRMDLFLFAMALGLETVPSEVVQKDSFVRAEYIRVKDEALLHSAFINEIADKEDIEDCVKKDKVYEFAERYANTGFELIKTMIDTQQESTTVLELIAELDEAYNDLFGA